MDENIYSPEFVKQLFNQMSSSYERMNFITSFGFSIRWRRQLISKFHSSKEKIEIIDLLTGMGETWNSVRQKFPNANLSALDFSSEMLKRAKNKSEQHFNNQVTLLQQNVLQNELPDNYYDIVICAFGLKTFSGEQLHKLANEIKRILKIGGKFSFIEVSSPHNHILKALYKFYLKHVIPILGKILIGNPTEYRMLWRYTEKFENARLATEIFKSVGLTASYNSYFYNCATGFNGHK